MVSFKLFEGDMRFPGFVQEDITRWVKNNDAENEETPDEQRHTYQPTRLLLLDGTLMVTLIDTRTDKRHLERLRFGRDRARRATRRVRAGALGAGRVRPLPHFHGKLLQRW